jgi:3-hydroxybutyryl-CoA dehydratase
VADRSFEDLTVGLTATRTYRFTEDRVAAFAALVEDDAPVHRDADFARSRGFEDRIVHGLFVQAVISGMLGTEVPGGNSVINSLTMKMHNPVTVGQAVAYRVEITALTPSVSAVSLSFAGTVDEKTIVSGKALCSFPAHREA